MRQSIKKTLLSAVGVDGSSVVKAVGIYDAISFQVKATGVTTGADVLIEVSEDGVTFMTYHTFNIVANGNHFCSIEGEAVAHVRTTVDNWTDGAYTVTLFARGE